MKTVILYLLWALPAALVGGINPAIFLSRRLYHRDIRTLGSGNPGFTNFRRCFGIRRAWPVLVLDLGKSALLCLLYRPIFARFAGSRQLGAAFAGLFAMVGHCFPVWYRFRGGKGFLAGAAAIFFVDWRAGLVALAVLVVLLLGSGYMSLSVMIAALTCPVSLWLLGVEHPAVLLLCGAGVCLLIVRHGPNIRRLRQGTEPKFRLGRSGNHQEEEP